MSDDFKLGKLEGKMESMDSKMDSVILTMNTFTEGLGKRIQEHDIKLNTLEIGHQEIRMELTKNCDRLYKKISCHISDHWKWITGASGFVVIASAIIGWIIRK